MLLSTSGAKSDYRKKISDFLALRQTQNMHKYALVHCKGMGYRHLKRGAGLKKCRNFKRHLSCCLFTYSENSHQISSMCKCQGCAVWWAAKDEYKRNSVPSEWFSPLCRWDVCLSVYFCMSVRIHGGQLYKYNDEVWEMYHSEGRSTIFYPIWDRLGTNAKLETTNIYGSYPRPIRTYGHPT